MLSFKLNHAELAEEIAVALDVQQHVIGLFGSSGAGKTSLLKGIAGLADDYVTARYFNEMALDNLQVCQSPIYYQDQNATLFPHLTVKKNLELVVSHGRFASDSPFSIEKVVQWCQIELILEHKPSQLSGGQMQRAAFAQSILSGNKLILLDEPFSALDWQAREHFCQLIQHLHKTYQLQFVLVSHSLKELALCTNYIVHLAKFCVTNAGSSQQMVSFLSQESVQNQCAVLTGTIEEVIEEFKLAKVRLSSANEGQIIFISKPEFAQRQVNVEIDAAKVSLGKSQPAQSSIVNCLQAQITNINATNSFVTVELAVEGQVLLANISLLSFKTLDFKVGDHVYAQFKVL
ncbi:ATP-binding cassette domain-containing protein [Thalassotalea ganghwensis]